LEINGAFHEEHAFIVRGLFGWRRRRRHLSLLSGIFFQNLSFRLVSRIVAVTENLKCYVNTRYAVPLHKVSVFPNGVNTRLFAPLEQESSRQKLGLDLDKRYVGFVGNLASWQGVDSLLTAFGLLDADCHDYHLLVVGDGMEKKRLQEMTVRLGLTNRVTFVGYVPYSDIASYINACDICVGPFNAQERNVLTGLSPLKIFEYLACGKPVLSSRIQDMQFIEDEGVGYLFRPSDERDMAEQMKALMNLPTSEHNAMGLRARALAVEKYSWDAIVGRIVESIQS
jgi:glycosyltransferase involved in cell wall biosynthesis